MAYRSAIIGYGGMGSWHHQNIKEKVPQIEVVGAWDVRPERLQVAQENGLYAYGSLEELLNDERIDLVTVATPNNFHKDLSIACMRHGKNVVCEKPVTMNAAELEQVIAVQQETGKLFSVHQNRRWDKDYRMIKKIYDERILGKPYMIETRVQGSRQVMHAWRGYKVNGGGMLLDWGVHLIDQVMMMIPCPVVSVYANLFEIDSKEVDDNFKAILRFEDRTSVLVEVSMNCFITQPRWHMSCEDGTVRIDDWSLKGDMVRLACEDEMAWEDVIVYTEAGPTRSMAPRPKDTEEHLPLPEVQSDWSEYYQNICGVLDGTAELIVKPEQALRVMRVVDAIFQSEQEGRSIQCRI
ncbi:MAG: Gfo/Idh/MocA family protein [Christensenellales bacterium]|jgi:scyllo-inositol 2-dehydrogenase (NADP+)